MSLIHWVIGGAAAYMLLKPKAGSVPQAAPMVSDTATLTSIANALSTAIGIPLQPRGPIDGKYEIFDPSSGMVYASGTSIAEVKIAAGV